MTADSFCGFVWNISYDQALSRIVKDDYTQFELPKKNGHRTISVLPADSGLFGLQKKFSSYFLNAQQLPVCVKGFVRGESYMSFLEPHIRSKYFLRIDVKDFFPSVDEKKIKKAFYGIIPCEDKKEKEKVLDLIADMCTYNGELPQGVPTSPMVSNIVMSRLDQRITKYCRRLDVKYTRYADDLLFSGDDLDFKEKKWFLKKIRYILSSQGLSLNYGKIKYGTGEISLNGYVVSEKGIRLSRGRLSDLKKAVSFSSKNYMTARSGSSLFLEDANNIPMKHRDLKRYPFGSLFQFLQYLAGYRSFLISFFGYDLDPSFRKKAEKLVRGIEKQIGLYY